MIELPKGCRGYVRERIKDIKYYSCQISDKYADIYEIGRSESRLTQIDLATREIKSCTIVPTCVGVDSFGFRSLDTAMTQILLKGARDKTPSSGGVTNLSLDELLIFQQVLQGAL